MSYAAKRQGVQRLQSLAEAQAVCPGLRSQHVEVTDEEGRARVPLAHEPLSQSTHKVSLRQFRMASAAIYRLLTRIVGPAFMQKGGIDEAFLDVSHLVDQFLEGLHPSAVGLKRARPDGSETALGSFQETLEDGAVIAATIAAVQASSSKAGSDALKGSVPTGAKVSAFWPSTSLSDEQRGAMTSTACGVEAATFVLGPLRKMLTDEAELTKLQQRVDSAMRGGSGGSADELLEEAPPPDVHLRNASGSCCSSTAVLANHSSAAMAAAESGGTGPAYNNIPLTCRQRIINEILHHAGVWHVIGASGKEVKLAISDSSTSFIVQAEARHCQPLGLAEEVASREPLAAQLPPFSVNARGSTDGSSSFHQAHMDVNEIEVCVADTAAIERVASDASAASADYSENTLAAIAMSCKEHFSAVAVARADGVDGSTSSGVHYGISQKAMVGARATASHPGTPSLPVVSNAELKKLGVLPVAKFFAQRQQQICVESKDAYCTTNAAAPVGLRAAAQHSSQDEASMAAYQSAVEEVLSPHRLEDVRLAVGAIIACYIRWRVRAELGFTCSVGIASNLALAKLATGRNKPAQQTIVPSASVPSLMQSLPVSKLRSLGGVFGRRLKDATLAALSSLMTVGRPPPAHAHAAGSSSSAAGLGAHGCGGLLGHKPLVFASSRIATASAAASEAAEAVQVVVRPNSKGQVATFTDGGARQELSIILGDIAKRRYDVKVNGDDEAALSDSDDDDVARIDSLSPLVRGKPSAIVCDADAAGSSGCTNKVYVETDEKGFPVITAGHVSSFLSRAQLDLVFPDTDSYRLELGKPWVPVTVAALRPSERVFRLLQGVCDDALSPASLLPKSIGASKAVPGLDARIQDMREQLYLRIVWPISAEIAQRMVEDSAMYHRRASKMVVSVHFAARTSNISASTDVPAPVLSDLSRPMQQAEALSIATVKLIGALLQKLQPADSAKVQHFSMSVFSFDHSVAERSVDSYFRKSVAVDVDGPIATTTSSSSNSIHEAACAAVSSWAAGGDADIVILDDDEGDDAMHGCRSEYARAIDVNGDGVASAAALTGPALGSKSITGLSQPSRQLLPRSVGPLQALFAASAAASAKNKPAASARAGAGAGGTPVTGTGEVVILSDDDDDSQSIAVVMDP